MFFLRTLVILNLWVCPLARPPDWLVTKVTDPVTFTKTPSGTWRLDNSLIYREFTVTPDFATVDFYSVERQQSLLRAINPEAVLHLDGLEYRVGGLQTGIPRAYLNRTALAEDMHLDNGSFHFVSFTTGKPTSPFAYTPRRGAPADIVWPARGLRVDVLFAAPSWAPEWHRSIKVYVHYEMYEGIPLLRKWISIHSPEVYAQGTRISPRSVEYLSVNDQWGSVSTAAHKEHSWLFVETDSPNAVAVQWATEPSAAAMPGSFEPAVNCSYVAPFTSVALGQAGFESFSVHELVLGSSDVTRSALARLRMLRLLAPHVQENPIFFHMTKSDSASMRQVRLLISFMFFFSFFYYLFFFSNGAIFVIQTF